MVKTTLEVDDDLWRRFSLLVIRERGERRKNEVVVRLLREYVERRGLTGQPHQLEHILQIEEEREAFSRLKEKLIQDPNYNGKYVAILHGSIIGCDEDKGRLARTVYQSHGYIPIYIDKVSPTERIVEAPSPELIRPEV
jgi:hypothetical protein